MLFLEAVTYTCHYRKIFNETKAYISIIKMWIIFNLKKEFRKIRGGFKSRDNKIINNSKELKRLREETKANNNMIKEILSKGEIVSKKEVDLMIREALLKSQSQEVSIIPPKSQEVSSRIETKLINRLRRSKKALVMAEISKLIHSHSVIEMYDEIVLNKGLCSKASFYRYVASLNSPLSLNSLNSIENVSEIKTTEH